MANQTLADSDRSDRIETPVEAEREVRRIAFWLSWGSLLPIIGWLRGAVMLWRSRHLSTRDKLIGTAMYPLGWTGAFISVGCLAVMSLRTCQAESYGVKGEAPSVANEWCHNASALDPNLGGLLAVAAVLAAIAGPIYVRWRGTRHAKQAGPVSVSS